MLPHNPDQIPQLLKKGFPQPVFAMVHHMNEGRDDLGQKRHALQPQRTKNEHDCLRHQTVVHVQRGVPKYADQGTDGDGRVVQFVRRPIDFEQHGGRQGRGGVGIGGGVVGGVVGVAEGVAGVVVGVLVVSRGRVQ